jgi:hypothetical protein
MFVYPLNITFGANGDYKLWAGEGWHHDESDREHTWTAHVAELRLPLPRARAALKLEIDLIPKGDDQDVFVYVNGGFAAFWRAETATRMSARVHANLLRPGENSITIVCPRASRPSGGAGDQRVLGVAVRSLGLSEMSG